MTFPYFYTQLLNENTRRNLLGTRPSHKQCRPSLRRSELECMFIDSDKTASIMDDPCLSRAGDIICCGDASLPKRSPITYMCRATCEWLQLGDLISMSTSQRTCLERAQVVDWLLTADLRRSMIRKFISWFSSEKYLFWSISLKRSEHLLCRYNASEHMEYLKTPVFSDTSRERVLLTSISNIFGRTRLFP
jgi:hypothetical protein